MQPPQLGGQRKEHSIGEKKKSCDRNIMRVPNHNGVCISSMIYSRDTPFWSGTLNNQQEKWCKGGATELIIRKVVVFHFLERLFM